MSITISESRSADRTPRAPDEKVTCAPPPNGAALPPKEVGGRDGPEPTRYGDWEKNGRCIDF
ncbi:MAG: DUF1674 domain-containing protein [Rudaea sp.]|uniref:DUF1674 domain-containing protein n=1 Tax=Rudaea sp. TaxID=2136325 RepID=UPI0039E2B74A